LRYDGETPYAAGFALRPGADTRDVLASAGFAEAEISDLLAAKVAFAAD
jgi:hypothetical protein